MSEARSFTQQAPSQGGASNMYKNASLTSLGGTIFERNQEATVYVGNLEPRVNEEIVWELFLQAGPVVNVHIPRDKVTNEHQSYGFVEFKTEEDADYSIKILHMIKLFNKPIKVNKASQDKRTQEVGANIFVGNLGENVDEKMLRDVFNQFGVVLSTKIMRDHESGSTKRYGFVSFDNFDSSDQAINVMNGQYLEGRPVDVSYAYKKDSHGEKHGSAAERVLAYCQAQRQQQTEAKITELLKGGSNQQVVEKMPPPPQMRPPQNTAQKTTQNQMQSSFFAQQQSMQPGYQTAQNGFDQTQSQAAKPAPPQFKPPQFARRQMQ